MIVDQRYRNRYLFAGLSPRQPFPGRWYKYGTIKKADTLDALAAEIEVPADALRETVERFNGFARSGVDEDFHRGESAYDKYYSDPTVKPNPSLHSIDQGPFYAVKIVPGDLGTKGGLVTDERARVLRPDGTVIDGLYAAGNVSAAVMGHTYAGPGATIGPALVFGYLAAEDIARRRIQRQKEPRRRRFLGGAKRRTGICDGSATPRTDRTRQAHGNRRGFVEPDPNEPDPTTSPTPPPEPSDAHRPRRGDRRRAARPRRSAGRAATCCSTTSASAPAPVPATTWTRRRCATPWTTTTCRCCPASAWSHRPSTRPTRHRWTCPGCDINLGQVVHGSQEIEVSGSAAHVRLRDAAHPHHRGVGQGQGRGHLAGGTRALGRGRPAVDRALVDLRARRRRLGRGPRAAPRRSSCPTGSPTAMRRTT